MHPYPTKPFTMEEYTLTFTIRAVLFQNAGPHNWLCLCVYYSCKLNPAEKNYDVWDKDLLGIKTAFEEWRHLLEGAWFPGQVLTDHKNWIDIFNWPVILINIRSVGHFSLPGLISSLFTALGHEMGRQMAFLTRKNTPRWTWFPEILWYYLCNYNQGFHVPYSDTTPKRPSNGKICQTLDTSDTLVSFDFHLHDGVLYHGKCLYIPEGQNTQSIQNMPWNASGQAFWLL